MLKTIKNWWTKPDVQATALNETLDLLGWITTQTWLNTRKIMNDLQVLQDAAAAQALATARVEDAAQSIIADTRNLAEAVLALRGDVAATDVRVAVEVLKEKAAATLARTNAIADALSAADVASDAVVADPVAAVEAPVVVADPVVTEPAAEVQVGEGAESPNPVVDAPAPEATLPVEAAPAVDAPADQAPVPAEGAGDVVAVGGEVPAGDGTDGPEWNEANAEIAARAEAKADEAPQA